MTTLPFPSEIKIDNYLQSDRLSVTKTWNAIACVPSDEVKISLAKLKPSYAAHKLIEVLSAAGVNAFYDRNTSRHRILLECAVQKNWASLRKYILGATCIKTKVNNVKQHKVVVKTDDINLSFYLCKPGKLYVVQNGKICFNYYNKEVNFEQKDLKSRSLIERLDSPLGAIYQVQETIPALIPSVSNPPQDNLLYVQPETSPDNSLDSPTELYDELPNMSVDQNKYIIDHQEDINFFTEFEFPAFNQSN
ncbi:hypothetical protein TVAG_046860 [Trichomonas vaginalis G3]|uniref:Uncharacterized protein n=1 Tax=Trichomonas vaginalis (strain ATCC PRA-98 / G3) TaxID=412133 RepID=A2EAR1_TRIV3|nr:hypothetical protein TVAGG3_0958730 [Trichomonas vaginalis G3]EAY10264.1 hypothetical protein TVAG_046860 [Trichomonas vaginalis G3]KAI5487748.1 hypothetical protein TVAGG3_0958730 [Trichomonas vaginalis G3]|eukprot:XP_001322487.1 hypothetical protein [Trichomonas vaginalis G3]